MDKVKLTTAIAAIVSFVVIGCKLLFGIELLTEGEIGEFVTAAAFVVIMGYQIYTKVSERIQAARADAEAKRADEAEKALEAKNIEIATLKTRFEKSLYGDARK